MKQAYLIIAHGNYNQLERLVAYLDDEDTDIYIHINKLVDMPDMEAIKNKGKQSNVYFTERVNVVWGEYGILEAMLVALREANKRYRYDYYHVLTGVDLPIKSKKSIKAFLENNEYKNNSEGRYKTNYVYIDEFMLKSTRDRVSKYNILIKYWRNKRKIVSRIARGINKIWCIIQDAFRIDRFKNCDFIIYKGAPWWSITNDFAEFILNNITWIKDNFTYMTFGADEFAVQTLIMNSDFKDSLWNVPDKTRNNMNFRLIGNEGVHIHGVLKILMS